VKTNLQGAKSLQAHIEDILLCHIQWKKTVTIKKKYYLPFLHHHIGPVTSVIKIIEKPLHPTFFRQIHIKGFRTTLDENNIIAILVTLNWNKYDSEDDFTSYDL